MVIIAAVELPESVDLQLIERASAKLPEKMRDEVAHYVQIMDQARSAFGKLLIHRFAGGGADPLSSLSTWHTDRNGRPSLPGRPPFNLTHSGRLVAIATRQQENEGPVGLDVERIKLIDFELFAPYMTESEWQDIRLSNNSCDRFFHFWTAKEAVMKAEGLGFNLPIREIHLQGELANVRGRTWQLSRPDFGKDYAAHLASAEQTIPGPVMWVTIEELLA